MTTIWDRKHRCWIYDFQIAGQRYSRRCIAADGTPATSKRQAEAIEEAAKVQARNAARGQAIVKPGEFSLAEAIAIRAAQARRFASWDGIRAAQIALLEFFGAGCPIAGRAGVAERADAFRTHVETLERRIWIGGPRKDIDRANPDFWRATGQVLSASRRNKYLDELRVVLAIAHKTKAPGTAVPHLADMPEIKPFDEPGRDPTPVPLYALGAIEADPKTPDHLWKAAALVRLVGLRKAEVFSATIDWIDWEAGGLRIPAAIAKSDRDDFLPANGEARELLAWLAADAADRAKNPAMSDGERDDARHLIVYRKIGEGKDDKPFAARPIKNARKAWASALRRVGVKHYRFHDVRATFVTQVAHVAPAAVTQNLARHKDAATTARYTKVADEAKRAAVEAMRSTANARAPGQFAIETPNAESQSRRLRVIK